MKLDEGEPQFERGRPNAFVDGLGHYLFSLPAKLILWNWKVDNHNISARTEAALCNYLEVNGMKDVKVRLNQYAPFDEYRRLFNNKQVGAGWRYTIGLLSVTFYMLLPQRLFGGDNYNPFTNTVNLYSDLAPVAIHEGGHAKDFAQRKWKGTYAVSGALPLASLRSEYLASSDAITYAQRQNQAELEKDSYKLLYPAYMTYVGGETLQWFDLDSPLDAALRAAFVIPGHIIGRYKANRVADYLNPGDESRYSAAEIP
ncbi:MAG: hypothetical protein V3T77_05105 [Planctomycetota bacterium]